ncbi:MAG: PIG-L family deacetylase [Eubacteriales bacterium]
MRTRIKRISTMLFVGAAALLLAAPAISLADASEAEDVTALAAVTAPQEGRAVRRMRDGNVETYSSFTPDETLSCTWADDTAIAGVYMEWYEPPRSVILVQTDADGREISREPIENPLYNDFYPLESAARALSVFSEDGMQIAEFALYSAGDLPADVYDWMPPVEKADLLVVAAHCDDELLFFGGTIPYYAAERGLSVQVAYLSDVGRLRVDEALNALWHAGVRHAPVFLDLKDVYTETLQDALTRWGEEDATTALISLIRRFTPEVIVTHDLDGEYGHGAHMATAYCMTNALPLAADESADPDSAAVYGAWQTKKLYLHLYGENAITMDWNIPLAAFGGKTALEVANEAYHMHVSQLEYHRNVYGSGAYSSANFGLAYSAVGPDEEKNDLFEHIDPAALTTYFAPAPSATPAVTAAPTIAPAPEPTAKTEEPMQANNVSVFLIAGISAFAAAFAAAMAVVVLRKKKNK